MLYRICMSILNLFFPPAVVLIIAGPEMDAVVNCALLLLAVIPATIHSFYLQIVFFHRRNKVKKGKPPGGPKALIYSPHILNGGASKAQLEEIQRIHGVANGSGLSRTLSRSRQSEKGGGSTHQAHRSDGGRKSEGGRRSGERRRSRTRSPRPGQGGRIEMWREGVARDGYGRAGEMEVGRVRRE